MRKVLGKKFFDRPAVEVARDLIGKYLVHRDEAGKVSDYQIHETEAYDGSDDLACHASKGRTARTELLFGEAGHFYIYLCYGMYYMLNVVAAGKDYPAGVLIRSAGSYDGPGKLTRALKIGRGYYGLKAHPKSKLWFEDRGETIPPDSIKTTPRIGVAYAKEWAKKPWRFVRKR